MKLRCALVVLCCALATIARGQWQVVSSKENSSANNSIKQWTVELSDPAGGKSATLNAVVFDSKRATLEVVDQGNAPQFTLAESMRRIQALAGVNGGYFDPEYAPVGLLVSGGHLISPLRKAKLLTGVLFATRTNIEIVRQTRFALSAHVRTAVQCGPLLVDQRAPVSGLNDTREARRTFAAVAGKGQVLLGISSSVSLSQLGRILCLTNIAGEFKTTRALNLDGGSSSGFWFAGTTQTVSIPESKTVRDFIAVMPASPPSS